MQLVCLETAREVERGWQLRNYLSRSIRKKTERNGSEYQIYLHAVSSTR